MAFFAVMHIFAFSWKPYNLKAIDHDPVAAATFGYGGAPPKYQGGFLGVLAIVDALNPWDIIKASARGFRWLFVGIRHRHEDASYQEGSKVGAMDGYVGPVYPGVGEAATELRPSYDDRSKPAQAADDRTGLLQHPGDFARVPTTSSSPYQGYNRDDHTHGSESQYDLGQPTQYGKAHDYGDATNTAYHGMPQSQQHPTQHPALRGNPTEVHDPNWNLFGGVDAPGARHPHDEQYPDRI